MGMKKCVQYVGFFLLLGVLLTSCAGSKNQGKLVQAGDVTKLIETATVLPDHTYYFTGPKMEPDAIAAIDNRYTMQSKYWIKVDGDVAAQLKSWNETIDNAHRLPFEREGRRMLNTFYTGAKIMSLDGAQIGIWYSRHDHTVINFPEPSTVTIFTPRVKEGGGPRRR